MKANQAFRSNDEAVSPVIAVILMVAITVVLAATVYVWVSGFGSQSGTPAKSLSLTTNGSESCALVNDDSTPATTDDDMHCSKTYVVASATQGMKYGDMTFTVDGATYAFVADAPNAEGEWGIRRGGVSQPSTSAVQAGDVITLFSVAEDDGGGNAGTQAAATQVGKQLRILDAQANSIVLTLTIT